jgi:hypothetical protein
LDISRRCLGVLNSRFLTGTIQFHLYSYSYRSESTGLAVAALID